MMAITAADPSAKNPSARSSWKPIWLVLLLLPALTVLLEFRLRDASGPYWLGANLDPSYAYLLNSLNIADLHRPYFIGHPGTPIHVTGAVTIRAMEVGASRGEIVKSVLTNPERYMTAINAVLVLFCAVCLVIAGLVVYLATGNLWSALIVQAAPFFSSTTFEGLTLVRPEPMMIGLATVVASLVIATFSAGSRKHFRRYAIAFGVAVGVGVACKINFVPIGVVPLIVLWDWKSRSWYIGATMVAFVMAILPMLEPTLIVDTIKFIFNMATHTGLYGSGPAGLIEPRNYVKAAVALVKGDALFFIVVLAGIAALALSSKFPAVRGPKFRALLAVTIAQVLQLLLTAKHPMSRYLIPSLALAGVELVVLIEVIRHILPKYRVPVFALLALFIVAHGIWSIRGLFQDLRTKGRTQLAVYETIVNNYPNVPVAGYYTTSSPYYALDFGQIYSGSLYRPVLKQLYPNQFFYNPWTGKFTDFSGPVTVEQVKGNGSWFILTGCSLSDPDFKIFLPPRPLPDQLQIESILEPVTDNPGLLDCGAIYKATTR